MPTQSKQRSEQVKTTAPAPDPLATALLDAARHIFENDGVQGVTVRRVALEAGCTTMVVYSRFQGKDGILGALFDEGFEKLSEAQQSIDPALKDAKRVVALCQAYRATAHSYPHHYALMMGHFSGALVPSVASQAKALNTLDYLTDAISVLPDRQKKARQHHKNVAHQLFAFCHGWVSLEHMQFLDRGPFNSAAFNRGLLSLIATSDS